MRTENAQQTSDEFMKAYSDFNTCSKKYPEYYYTSQKEEENEDDLDIDNLDVVPDELVDEGGENNDQNESAKTEASWWLFKIRIHRQQICTPRKLDQMQGESKIDTVFNLLKKELCVHNF